MLHRRRRTVATSEQSPRTSASTDSATATADSGSRSLRHPTAKLGQILVEEEVISRAQLEEALEHKRKQGGFLGQALMDLNILDQSTLTTFLVKQCKIPHLSLNDYTVDAKMADIAPRELCEQYGLLPIDKMGKILTVAMVDPLDKEAMDALSAAAPELQIKPIHCDWRDFERAYHTLFPGSKPKVEEGVASMADFGLAPAATQSNRHPKKETPVAEEVPEPPQNDAESVSPHREIERGGSPTEVSAPPQSGPVAAAVNRDAEELAVLFERIATALEHLEQERETAPSSTPPATAFGVETVDSPDAAKVIQEHYLLDTYVPGTTNEEAVALARQFVQHAAGAGETLLLSGAPGSGKSHLALGIAREAAKVTGTAAGYISCEKWAGDPPETPAAAVVPGRFGTIVIDDLHRLYGRIEAQNALVDRLTCLHAEGGRTIITYTAEPEALGGFDPQLLSRLHGGVSARLDPPAASVCVAVGKQFVRRKKLDVPDDVIEHLAGFCPGDARKLMGKLLQVAVTAEMRGSTVTMDLVSELEATPVESNQ